MYARPLRCPSLTAIGLLAATVLASCAARTPVVAVGSEATTLDALLDAYPLRATEELRADEIARTPAASYHVVQVRGQETPHRHATHDLTVMVLRGQGTLMLTTRRVEMAAGDAALIPRGAAHWFQNMGQGVAVALVVFTPALDAPDTVPVTAVETREERR